MLSGIHEDFYNARNLTDEDELNEKWKEAQHLLDHFKFYYHKMNEMKTTNKVEAKQSEGEIKFSPGFKPPQF